MASEEVRLTVVVDNEEAMIALEAAIAIAEEMAEDQPWNENAKELAEKLMFVINSVELVEPGELKGNLADELVDDMEGYAEYLENGGDLPPLPFEPENN